MAYRKYSVNCKQLHDGNLNLYRHGVFFIGDAICAFGSIYCTVNFCLSVKTCPKMSPLHSELLSQCKDMSKNEPLYSENFREVLGKWHLTISGPTLVRMEPCTG